MKLLWANKPHELLWRQELKAKALVDAEDWEKKWQIGQIMAVGYDPLVVLVAFHGKSLRTMQWFNR